MVVGQEEIEGTLKAAGFGEGSRGVTSLVKLLRGAMMNVFAEGVGIGRKEFVENLNKNMPDKKTELELGNMNSIELGERGNWTGGTNPQDYKLKTNCYYWFYAQLMGLGHGVNENEMKLDTEMRSNTRFLNLGIASDMIAAGKSWLDKTSRKRLSTLSDCAAIVEENMGMGCAGCVLMVNMLTEAMGELLMTLAVDEAMKRMEGRSTSGQSESGAGKGAWAENALHGALLPYRETSELGQVKLAHAFPGMARTIKEFEEAVAAEKNRQASNIQLAESNVRGLDVIVVGLLKGAQTLAGKKANNNEVEVAAWEAALARVGNEAGKLGAMGTNIVITQLRANWKNAGDNLMRGIGIDGEVDHIKMKRGPRLEEVGDALRKVLEPILGKRNKSLVDKDGLSDILVEEGIKISAARETDRIRGEGKSVNKLGKQTISGFEETKKFEAKDVRQVLAGYVGVESMNTWAEYLKSNFLDNETGEIIINKN
jgi:hypothetical protein